MTRLVLLQFLLCPVVFLTLMYVTAPYGRHFKSGWGPALPNRMAWFLMELPALLAIGVWLAVSPESTKMLAFIPWVFWSIHYSYRTFLFPLRMRPSGKSFPVLLVVFAIAFNILNGYNNAQALIDNAKHRENLLSIHFVLGTGLFGVGLWMHVRSDQIIRDLRSNGFTGYRIPKGGWFRWVSSPHYLGEILQWLGWAVLTWTWAGLAFALFTFCNLVPRAIANHQWYKATFADYPPDRKVILPGIF